MPLHDAMVDQSVSERGGQLCVAMQVPAGVCVCIKALYQDKPAWKERPQDLLLLRFVLVLVCRSTHDTGERWEILRKDLHYPAQPRPQVSSRGFQAFYH